MPTKTKTKATQGKPLSKINSLKHLAGIYVHLGDLQKQFPGFKLQGCQPCTRLITITASTRVSIDIKAQPGATTNQIDIEL